MTIKFNGKNYYGIIWMLDAGHGIETAGKRSPVWEDGKQLLEYDYNRKITTILVNKYSEYGNAWFQRNLITVGDHDWPLGIRATRANRIYHKYPNHLCIFLSIHGDYYRSESVHGTTLYTSPGQTDSDDLARMLKDGMFASTKKRKQRLITTHIPEEAKFNLFKPHTWKFRNLKEARFTVLTKTEGPAILLETGFYSNRMECSYMLSKRGQQQIADTIFDGMHHIYNELKIDYKWERLLKKKVELK